MTLVLRDPTGLPSWPILLIAGVEKSGKTYAAAEASGSDLIGRTLWWTLGEDDPDEYAQIPGARFQIVDHDGTYRGVLDTLTDPEAEERVDGKPALWVVDSLGRGWAMLSDQAQGYANTRAREKARRAGKAFDDAEEADVAMDLWNRAKGRWAHIVDALRRHDGPVIVTTRLDEVTIVDGEGRPTRQREWKVQAEKNLPYDVGAIVQLRAHREAYLTGVKSLRYQLPPSEVLAVPDFTVDGLWRNLGMAETVGARSHTSADPTTPEAQVATLLAGIREACEQYGVDPKVILTDWAESHEGQHIAEATDLGGLELILSDIPQRAKEETK